MINEKVNQETAASETTLAKGRGEISRELEDEIFEKRLLQKLDCIEKLNNGRNKKNFFIVHPNHGMLYQYKELAAELEREFIVYGLLARGLKPKGKMPENPDRMVEDYIEQILKVQKKGPFLISGFCGGNAVAYEITRRLELRKHEVKALVLLDSPPVVRDGEYKFLRMLRYYPAFKRKKIMSFNMDAFEREMRANKFILKDDDDGNFRKKKVEKYMDTLVRYVFYFGFINAPIVTPQSIDSPRPLATQERFDRMTRSAATLIKVPGTHNGILEQPYVKRLAEVIINSLEKI